MSDPTLYALVLTVNPASAALDPITAGIARTALAGHTIASETWLAGDEAWEAIFLAELDFKARDVRARLQAALGDRPIDVNIVPAASETRRKQLLVADMESTIVQQEFLDELADVAGIGPQVAAITDRAMRGELDFEAALKERVHMLKGLDASVLDTVFGERATLMPGAQTLLGTMRAHGAFCALVSGGFTVFTSRVAQWAGFDAHQANIIEIADGRLTGRVSDPILGRDAKLAALQRYARQFGLDMSETLATGDGANDLSMIDAAGLGVAFRAKPLVAASARASIAYADLTALLYLQGIRKDEFAS